MRPHETTRACRSLRTMCIDGVEVSMNHEYHEPVETVVVDILAARCGPLPADVGETLRDRTGW